MAGVRLLLSLVDTLSRREQLAVDFRRELPAETQLTPAAIDLTVTLGAVLATVFGFALAAIGVLVVHQLGKGKLWARTVLTFAGVWLAVSGLITLISIGSVDGVLPMVSGAASLVQAVLAVGAIYLCQRPEAAKWFLPPRSRSR